MSRASSIGIIGMGVMGKSLALNFAGKGIPVAVYNRHVPGKEEYIASRFAAENKNEELLQGFDSLDEFMADLEKPKKILLMVTAGPAIDELLKQLLPYLKKGDVIMDGGNSFYKDTERRVVSLSKSNIYYLGVGISGGEEGALTGPSLMPGGSEEGYAIVRDLLNTAAAKDKEGNACCTYIGEGGAGHFVKMVHNGIEYAEMQLLAELYFILKTLFGLGNDEIADFFKSAAKKGASGFLLEATIEILSFKEGAKSLLDKILDKSEQKGTGGWVVKTALDYNIPVSTISEAVFARFISSQKEKRRELSSIYRETSQHISLTDTLEQELVIALETSRLINHLSGFDLIIKAASENSWHLDPAEVARIWTNGCIIRSSLMEELVEVYRESPKGWSNESITLRLQEGKKSLVEIIAIAMRNSKAVPVLCAALNHLNGMTTANSPANLIQAQRDYFGAHTYERIDKAEGQYFHTNWKKEI
jgi:6-phosphogluconate dehydrogenase